MINIFPGTGTIYDRGEFCVKFHMILKYFDLLFLLCVLSRCLTARRNGKNVFLITVYEIN